jgi:hypothetical protein
MPSLLRQKVASVVRRKFVNSVFRLVPDTHSPLILIG